MKRGLGPGIGECSVQAMRSASLFTATRFQEGGFHAQGNREEVEKSFLAAGIFLSDHLGLQRCRDSDLRQQLGTARFSIGLSKR